MPTFYGPEAFEVRKKISRGDIYTKYLVLQTGSNKRVPLWDRSTTGERKIDDICFPHRFDLNMDGYIAGLGETYPGLYILDPTEFLR